jgi:hypothetical protein
MGATGLQKMGTHGVPRKALLIRNSSLGLRKVRTGVSDQQSQGQPGRARLNRSLNSKFGGAP